MRHLIRTLEETKQRIGITPAGIPGHDVQFYWSEEHLAKTVTEFLADGVRAGQPIVVIATERHRQAFEKGLIAKRLDPEKILSGRHALWLDARETLASFMVGGRPDRELFFATVGNVFERVLNRRYHLIVRGYGEMVDLLWKDANTEGAILLEKLWNELAGKYPYSLLCGYAVDNFLHEAGAEDFRSICAQHEHALPLELFGEPLEQSMSA
jgi:hypothetical protein